MWSSRGYIYIYTYRIEYITYDAYYNMNIIHEERGNHKFKVTNNIWFSTISSLCLMSVNC